MTSTKYSMGIIKQICRVKIDKMTQYMYFKDFFSSLRFCLNLKCHVSIFNEFYLSRELYFTHLES